MSASRAPASRIVRFECLCDDRRAALVRVVASNAIKDGTTVVSDKPYDIERTAAECDFGVCHAGHGTTCALLLAGKPVLPLPMQLEQYLTAKRVGEIGAGVIVEGEKPQSDFGAAASQIIGNPDFARRAQEFAQRYTGHSSSSTVTRIAKECEEFVRHSEKRNDVGSYVPRRGGS